MVSSWRRPRSRSSCSSPPDCSRAASCTRSAWTSASARRVSRCWASSSDWSATTKSGRRALFERAERADRRAPRRPVGVARRAPAARDQLQPQHDLLPGRARRRSDRGTIVAATWIDSQYFATLGVPLLRGTELHGGRHCRPRRESRSSTSRSCGATGRAATASDGGSDARPSTVPSSRSSASSPTTRSRRSASSRRRTSTTRSASAHFTGEVLIARTCDGRRGAPRGDAPRNARARAERGLPRQPDDGRAGGGDAAAGAARGADDGPGRRSSPRSSPRSASTASSPTPSAGARARSASAWRSARRPATCWGW